MTTEVSPQRELNVVDGRLEALESASAGQGLLIVQLTGNLAQHETETAEALAELDRKLGEQGRWEEIQQVLNRMERRVQLVENRMSALEQPQPEPTGDTQ